VNVSLHFVGPYSWFPGDLPSVLEKDETTTQPGIYLWTADTPHGELVYYIGETGRSFRMRFQEHLTEQTSGWYRFDDPAVFRSGGRKRIWPGLYEAKEDRAGRWQEWLQRLPELTPSLVEFVRQMRFHLAPLECDTKPRRRIEAAIALHLRDQPGAVGAFQDPDITYWPTKPRDPPLHATVTSSTLIQGLPRELDLTPR
jgi:hypothetical protein